MKVLMLADGTSIHTRRILDWHLKNGCEVTFVDHSDPNPEKSGPYNFVRYPGLRGGRYLKWIIGKRLVSRLNDSAIAFGLKRIFRRVRPDVVHLYQIDTRAHDCYRARLRPLVMSSWGTDINQHFRSTADPDYRGRTSKALAAADLVIADAVDIIEKCSSLAGRKVPTELLLLGVDTTLFRPGYEQAARKWRRELAIPDKAPVLLSIRALAPVYGHELILDAFHLAFPKFRRKAFLVFKAYSSRNSDEYQHALQRHGRHLGIGDWLRWSDRVPFEQLPALYSAVNAVINYPAMDAFPVTFLEAAACKCPVISNRLPGYAGTFAEKYFNMVEQGNLSALADAMVEAINGATAARQECLDGARATVEKSFSEISSAEQLMRIYGNLTQQLP